MFHQQETKQKELVSYLCKDMLTHLNYEFHLG
jgi:hypothetical protein